MRIGTELQFLDGSTSHPAAEAPSPLAERASHIGAAEVMFAGLLAAAVLPIWAVGRVPTQDGASHVETLTALLRLHGSPLLQRHFVANVGLQPNWLAQVLWMALQGVFAPGTAEKLLLTGYVVLLPVAVYLVLPATRRARWAALAVFPLVYSYAFHMGFWSFTYSLVLYVAAVGFWWRRRGRLRVRDGVVLSVLLLLAYFAHSVSTSAALASMAALAAWRGALDVLSARGQRARLRRVVRGHTRRALATLAAAAPVVVLLGAFFLRQRRSVPVRPPLLDYAKHLGTLYALVSYDFRELALTVPLALALAGAVAVTLLARRQRRLRPSDAWLAAAALGVVLYFAAPDTVIDGAQLNDRLALYPWLAIVLWLGTGAVPGRTVRTVAAVAVVVFAVGTAYRVARYRAIDVYLADYLAVAPHVPEGSTILPLTFAPAGPRRGGALAGPKLLSYRIEVARHVAGLVATERHGVNLGNSQANTRHAPLRWRPEMNPFTLLDTHHASLEDEPPCVSLAPYEAQAGPIDAVIVWGATPATARTPCGAAVFRQLAAGWERTYVSPHGDAELYLRSGRERRVP